MNKSYIAENINDMLKRDEELQLSPYAGLYDIVVPKNNILRRINDLVDFSFVYDELENKYSSSNGRMSESPIRMFKYLVIKSIDELSDADLVEHSRYDMSYKYFLGMRPEEDVINPSTLTKFRKLRLKDENLLDMLICKTVQIAVSKGFIRSDRVIVDSTHSRSRYNALNPMKFLRRFSSKLRESIEDVDIACAATLPEENGSDDLSEEMTYCKRLIESVSKSEKAKEHPRVYEKANYMSEMIADYEDHKTISRDRDARTGHKSANTKYYGYKTHIALSEDRFITAAKVTSGESSDGKELPSLVEKSMANGVKVGTVVGDGAYSAGSNIEYARSKNIRLVSRLNRSVMAMEDAHLPLMEYNKDSQMITCRGGLQAYREERTRTGRDGVRYRYFFNEGQCITCKFRKLCHGDKMPRHAHTIELFSPQWRRSMKARFPEQVEFQQSEEFNRIQREERYKIEEKNSELKNAHGYDRGYSMGIDGMEMQGAFAIFAVNMKRLINLMGSDK